MTLKFGTSGVRGLVTEMTDQACFLYAQAFARHLLARSGARSVSVAGDLRGSTPRILRAVAAGLRAEGLEVTDCGTVPTPAVTLHGLSRGQASVMVTGSHIPDDRNGIKFNMPWGEVLKEDEVEISRRYLDLSRAGPGFEPDGAFAGPPAPAARGEVDDAARAEYIARYLSFFEGASLAGMRLVLWEHSSAGRDVLAEILGGLGAEVVRVGRSDRFVAVDTEAVEDLDRLARWVAEHRADALVSADGDGDRPLLVDETGRIVRGDVLGILVASFLGAESVSVPVSCNTALERSGRFRHVSRTRIGSPYVIASMAAAVEAGRRPVVGFEANGGFLTATDIRSPDGARTLRALPTRDAALPLVAALLASRGAEARKLSALVATLPRRFTWSDLVRGVPTERGLALVDRIRQGGASAAVELLGGAFGPVEALDFTDGARVTFASGDIVHLRPSGNAPEFRCYTESDTEEHAARANERALALARSTLGTL